MVYKRNTRVDGKPEFYVAKTIAKGYSLKLCFNCGKHFQQWSYSNPSDYSYIAVCLIYKIQQSNIFIAKSLVCTRRNREA